ncbi:ImmA/IrrE family metallo-endopeptidase [Corynebacterium cystitidis]|uniref:ImmA/IrrE family metallo-endopeptidase n=1 Tax=Corynebacterium cystitidis TaxID=35757 RepID=UPI00211EDE12|nr:ImmA/IrrE family metallo-endopeptidase [Corynebacterium cystitidis]
MTITTTDLENLAHMLGLTITEHDQGEKARHYPARGVISLQRGLGPINRKCALAHELGHHFLGHQMPTSAWMHARQEHAADRWAADLLITPDSYRDAETSHGPHTGAIALELDVTKHLVEVWRNNRATTTK